MKYAKKLPTKMPNLEDYSPNIAKAEHLKMLMNIGGPWDSCTGEYILGHNGRWVLNGGMPNAGGVAIVGAGNTFKSTVLHGMQLALVNLLAPIGWCTMNTLDTEVNIQQHHLEKMSNQHSNLQGKNLFRTGVWTVTDATKTKGEEFFNKLKEAAALKKKLGNSIMVATPFLNAAGDDAYMRPMPSLFAIDSFTDFKTSASDKVADKLELDDVKNNMIPMHKGLIKDRLLSKLPELLMEGNFYMAFTAHVGKNKQDIGSPSHLPPTKELTTMRNKDKIKGVTERFFFAMGLVYQVMFVKVQTAPNKAVLYPADKNERHRPSNDLNEVTLRILRSKSSMSGNEFKAILSQRTGLNIPLSIFHNLKINKRYGMPGNDTNYACEFLPDIKLNRTNIQTKLKEEPKLVRALEICLDLFYIDELRLMPDTSLSPNPAELHESLTKLGYDWDKILSTRGRHSVNEQINPVPCYSTMDLIYIAKGAEGFDFDELKIDKK